MIIAVCSARRHGARYAYGRDRCNCPDAMTRRTADRAYRGRTYIRGHGRAGPRNGYDEVVVDRLLGGDRTLRPSRHERAAAVDRLDQPGTSAAQIAVRLGITVRTVQRYRARRRAARTHQEATA